MSFHADWVGPGADFTADAVNVHNDDGTSVLSDDEQALLTQGIDVAAALVQATPHAGWHNVNVWGSTGAAVDGFEAGDHISVAVNLIAPVDGA